MHRHAKSDLIPIGAYHKLLCSSSKRENWELCQKEHLSYTDASFRIQEAIRLAMTLLQKEIRISVWSDGKVEYEELKIYFLQLKGVCKATLSKLGITENNSFVKFCPNSSEQEAQCLVRVKKNKVP